MQIAFVAILLVAVTAVSGFHGFHDKIRKHMEASPCYDFVNKFCDKSVNCTGFKSTKYSDADFESTIKGMIQKLKDQHIGADFDETKTHVCENIMRMKLCYIETHKMLNADNSLNCEPLFEAAKAIKDEKVQEQVNAAITKACEIKSTLPVPAAEEVGYLFRNLMEICPTEQQKEMMKKCQKKIADGETPQQAIQEVLEEAEQEEAAEGTDEKNASGDAVEEAGEVEEGEEEAAEEEAAEEEASEEAAAEGEAAEEEAVAEEAAPEEEAAPAAE